LKRSATLFCAWHSWYAPTRSPYAVFAFAKAAASACSGVNGGNAAMAEEPAKTKNVKAIMFFMAVLIC
jgi:hypothetical protein